MTIAYLIHSERPYDELQELITQLTKQGDHVFIMINDNELRDQIAFTFMEYSKVHISQKQMYAQEGDLSLARGTLMQMKEALQLKNQEFDYFINLTDGMVPLKSRMEILAYLKQYPDKDFFYVDRSEKDDPDLRKKTEKYYPYTNIITFPTNKFVRAMTRGMASILYAFHSKHNLEDEILIGSPWFILTRKSAEILIENFSYCSNTYKLSWYAEELYIPMMLHKFAPERYQEHINDNLRAVGDGKWIESHVVLPCTTKAIETCPNALFGGRISAETEAGLYSSYFDIYNANLG